MSVALKSTWKQSTLNRKLEPIVHNGQHARSVPVAVWGVKRYNTYSINITMKS